MFKKLDLSDLQIYTYGNTEYILMSDFIKKSGLKFGIQSPDNVFRHIEACIIDQFTNYDLFNRNLIRNIDINTLLNYPIVKYSIYIVYNGEITHKYYINIMHNLDGG